VARRGRVEAAVERAREPELLVVSKHDEAFVLDRAEELDRPVAGAVVDHDELQLAQRLAQKALDRRPERRCGIVGGEHDRDKGGRGRHEAPTIAFATWTIPCRSSISWSRLSVARSSSTCCSRRSPGSPIKASASSSSTRTRT